MNQLPRISFLNEVFDDAGLDETLAALPGMAALQRGRAQLHLLTVAGRDSLVDKAARHFGPNNVTPWLKLTSVWGDTPLDDERCWENFHRATKQLRAYCDLCETQRGGIDCETLLAGSPPVNYADLDPLLNWRRVAAAINSASWPKTLLVYPLNHNSSDMVDGALLRTFALTWWRLFPSACARPVLQKFDRPIEDWAEPGVTHGQKLARGTSKTWHAVYEHYLINEVPREPNNPRVFHLYVDFPGCPWSWPLGRVREAVDLVRAFDPYAEIMINPGSTNFAQRVGKIAQALLAQPAATT